MGKDIKLRLRCSDDLSKEDLERLLWDMINRSKNKIIFIDRINNDKKEVKNIFGCFEVKPDGTIHIRRPFNKFILKEERDDLEKAINYAKCVEDVE